MVDAKIFKGIEYVQLSDLPEAQREVLTQTINPELFIKLLIDGKIISGCLQYKDYNRWYQEQLQQKLNAPVQESALPPVEIQPNLALNKI